MRRQRSLVCFVGMGLMLGAASCSSEGNGDTSYRPQGPGQLGGSSTKLLRAQSCDDLLGKIQDDAVAKLDLAVEQYKAQATLERAYRDGRYNLPPDVAVRPGLPVPLPALPTLDDSSNAAPRDSSATPPVAPGAGSVTSGAGQEAGGGDFDSKGEVVGASETNTQVQGVDEADFVKLVDSGKGMFVLHGNRLNKLTSFPAEQLALSGAGIEIEGQPSELFVTDAGRAVVFSTVYNYNTQAGGGAGVSGAKPAGDVLIDCGPGYCGGYGSSSTKITVLDVSGATFKTVRELYYAGNYVSSRRYDDVVRVVLQAQTSYGGLYSPDVNMYDSFNRPLSDEELSKRLDAWRTRVAEEIRTTALKDWLPAVQEAKDGKLVEVDPACDSYFVPQPGLADFGLTHVLSLDVAKTDAKVGGVTILGQAATVYSSLDRLVFAQPDYRWGSSTDRFGVIDEQRTSLHVFGLEKADTSYVASGWVPGGLPSHNQQFGIDVTADHTLRVVTTGSSRKNPSADPGSPAFWETSVENHVFTLQAKNSELSTVGKSENLGHVELGETVQSARFVGDRAYVVTFRQTDPLIVLDVANPASPTVLGQIEIPGFSQYMHPLDETHLITFGRSGTGGSQLQLFDVSNPAASIPAPKTLDFGEGGWSEVANNHKAFTFYAKQSLLALPVSGTKLDAATRIYRPEAALQVVKVDKDAGFTLVGSVEHSKLYEQQSCLTCSFGSCYYSCGFGGIEMRRGHFVETTESTYVYGISYGGVSVSNLSSVGTPIKTVTLPQPKGYQGVSWYGGGVGSSSTGGGAANDIAVPPAVSDLPVPQQDAGAARE